MSSPFESLFSACSTGDAATLNSIVSETPSLALSPSQIQTLFETCASNSQPSALQLLLTRFPSSVPHQDTIRAAIYTGSAPVLRILLAYDPHIVNTLFDKRGSPLSLALSARLPLSYIRFLLDAGADPNGDTVPLPTPLAHAAALYDAPDAVATLITHGARIQDSGAIKAAASAGRTETERFLLAQDGEVSNGGT